MKPLVIQEQKSAKSFLFKMVPCLIRAVGIEPVQSFLGFKINLEAEAQNRIRGMTEEKAKTALDALKVMMQEW